VLSARGIGRAEENSGVGVYDRDASDGWELAVVPARGKERDGKHQANMRR
jgi:hypothetical protein